MSSPWIGASTPVTRLALAATFLAGLVAVGHGCVDLNRLPPPGLYFIEPLDSATIAPAGTVARPGVVVRRAASGERVAGVRVAFEVYSDSTSVLRDRVSVTDSAGIARAAVMLRPTAGTVYVHAQVDTTEGAGTIVRIIATAPLAGFRTPTRLPTLVRILDPSGRR